MSETDFSLRNPAPGVSTLFSERWSPRAFAEYTIPQDQLLRIMDAARWAPSCFNEQPWVFYTSNETTFSDYLNLLVEGNQVWAKNASVIGFLIGKRKFSRNQKDNDWFQLDCGAAWMSMTLQAQKEGLYTHGMGGIKKDAVAAYLNLDSQNEAVLMGFAIGKMGDKATLPEDMQANEQPSGRKALDEIWQR